MLFPRHSFDEDDGLLEFDQWVTPSMGEIKDAVQFITFFDLIKSGMEALSKYCDGFKTLANCGADRIASSLLAEASENDIESKSSQLFSVLMMLTGKTDNNLKCQFPVYLTRTLNDESYPCVRRGALSCKEVPRTLTSDAVSSSVAELSGYPVAQRVLLEKYLRLLVGDLPSQRQVWSVGLGFESANACGCGDDFLTTLVVFFKRGSITASKGHEPENILRERMREWGMLAGSDFNTDDVAVVDLLGQNVDARVKKRKYDFILPYRSRADIKKGQIFIQCQFYAGDSGSVSHKNVDQTTATRKATKRKIPEAIFVEYIDGAGYYSSLNGDLKRLLHMDSTYDFIQVKTSPIKLRRCLQEIGYLTPLEIAQEILRSGQDKTKVCSELLSQGYEKKEIDTAIMTGVSAGYLVEKGKDLLIGNDSLPIVRRYCILDCLAVFGAPLSSDNLAGNLIVPGYELFRGMPQNELILQVKQYYPSIVAAWTDIQDAFDDLQWLIDLGFIQGR